jgi:hypothetical protein
MNGLNLMVAQPSAGESNNTQEGAERHRPVGAEETHQIDCSIKRESTDTTWHAGIHIYNLRGTWIRLNDG